VKPQPLISVIIPTRNCRDILIRLLDSIDRQTFRDFEVLVVDNHSTDGTFELASSRSTRSFQKGPERHIQRTFGAEQAFGEYLMFFDADMELDPNLFENCLELGKQGYDAVIIPERGGGEGFWASCQKLEKKCYWNDVWMEAANRFIRTNVYKNVGGYRADLIAGEDFELHDRLVAARARIGRSSAMLTHYEDARFWTVVRKKFYYATKMKTIFKESPIKNTKRFVLFKPAYLRNWKLLLQYPLQTLGLVLMKGVQFFAGSLGLIVACLKPSRE
jgi:glycosyltransferase involved in cell wall biosynthesis